MYRFISTLVNLIIAQVGRHLCMNKFLQEKNGWPKMEDEHLYLVHTCYTFMYLTQPYHCDLRIKGLFLEFKLMRHGTLVIESTSEKKIFGSNPPQKLCTVCSVWKKESILKQIITQYPYTTYKLHSPKALDHPVNWYALVPFEFCENKWLEIKIYFLNVGDNFILT
jgi:hypothetical protein